MFRYYIIKIAVLPYLGITAIFSHGGDNRAKSEHVYFVNGMLVLFLNFAKK